MKKSLRVLILLLVVCMFVGLLTACGKKKGPTTPTSEADPSTSEEPSTTKEVETNEYGEVVIDDSKLDGLDFGNTEIIFASRAEDRYCREFEAESVGDNVDTKIFARNLKVENQLNVDLVFKRPFVAGKESDALSDIIVAHEAGIHVWDVVSMYAYDATRTRVRDCYVDFYDPDLTYIDLSQHYWNQNYIQNATVFDHLYYAIGDMNLSVWDRALVLWTNMTFAENNGYSDLYQEVLNGEWTIARLKEIVADIGYTDLDGTDTLTKDDRFALTACYGSEFWDGFTLAFDLKFLGENDDGTHTMLIQGNDKMETALAALQGLYNNQNAVLTFTNVADPMNAFVTGKALFNIDVLARMDDTVATIRNMKDKYGVLPLPKYDAEQTNYYTTSQDAYNVMSIMDWGGLNKPAVGATLELMNSFSYSDVRPYYVERVLKMRYSESNDAIQVMEKIFAGIGFDTGHIYGSQVGNIVHSIWRVNLGTIESAYESNKVSLATAIEEFDAFMMGH